MGLRSLIGLTIVALAFVFVGCDSDKAQKIQPETRGKRNELCQARNDCEDGLACLNGVCSKNQFGLEVSAKQCDRIECEEDTDCCGDRPMTAPAKCKDRATVCTPQLPGCVNDGNVCTSDATCTGGGSCPMGTCSSGVGACATSTECLDRCVDGTCRVSGAVCTPADESTTCTLYFSNYSCSTRFCSCANPAYEPGNPICTDPACDPSAVCTLRCDEERCVQDNSCEEDTDCNAAAPMCDDGRCVQCLKASDCDEDENEECEAGFCKKPCEVNEECPVFSECQDGDCVYVGCKEDKDCILAANRNIGDGTGGTQALAINGGDDPRLYRCRPSEVEENVSVCLIPCENDGSCGQFQSCQEGFCKFIGCENDEQCRAYLGIANQMQTEERPFVPKAVCRE
jgi:hypothetical protein